MRISKAVLTDIVEKEVKSEVQEALQYDKETDQLSRIAELIEEVFRDHKEKCNTKAEEQWLRNLINLFVTKTLYTGNN